MFIEIISGVVEMTHNTSNLTEILPKSQLQKSYQGSKLQGKSAFPSEKFVWNLLIRTPKHFSESIPATENFIIVLNAYKSKWLLFCWINHFLNFENRSSTSDFIAPFVWKSWLEIYFSTSIFPCLGKAENQ